MVSSVRAVALQALAERKRLSLEDLGRYEKYARRWIFSGWRRTWMPPCRFRAPAPWRRSLAGRILAHANQSGGQFQFTETWDDGYYQM